MAAKKNYEVKVTAYATVLVIAAEDEDKALEYAEDQLNFGNLQMDEMSVVKEVTSKEELDSLRRHADAIAEE